MTIGQIALAALAIFLVVYGLMQLAIQVVLILGVAVRDKGRVDGSRTWIGLAAITAGLTLAVWQVAA